jgi:C4-dicarboxylate transporter, DctQ subunit
MAESTEPAHMTFLDRWIDKAGSVFSFLFAISGAIIVYEVVARYVFSAPTIWGHETTTLLCALCFAFGGSYCLARNSHIRIVMVYDRVSPAARRLLNIFINFTGVVWGAFLSWAGWTLVEKSWFAPWGELRLETSASAWDPPFPAYIKGFLMVMLVVMTLQFVLKLAHSLRR